MVSSSVYRPLRNFPNMTKAQVDAAVARNKSIFPGNSAMEGNKTPISSFLTHKQLTLRYDNGQAFNYRFDEIQKLRWRREGEADNAWREFTAEWHGSGLTETAAEAERHLLEQINDAVDTLTTLDVARWDGLDADVTTSATAVGGRPPTMEARSVRLASRSAQVLHVVEVAIADSGGARSASETQERAEALRSVERAARRAHAVAWNAGLGASPSRR